MRFLYCIPLLVFLAGCSAQQGQVDFASPPVFKVPLGEYRALLFYSDSTVLRMGGSYYTLEVGSQQVREFFGIDAVVFVFTPVNGPHVERVSQHKRETGGLTGIGQPVPAEHALAADGQVLAVRFDQFEEEFEVVVFDVGVDQLLALPVHDADVHLAGVQIDSAVVFRSGDVILHSV